jgi:hypothetical protein
MDDSPELMQGTVARLSLLLTLAIGCDSDDCAADLVAPMTVSYEQTLDEWAGPLGTDGTRPHCSDVERGRCSDGKQFLAGQFYLGGSVRYFDDDRTIVAWAQGWDHDIEAVCPPVHYGPSRAAARCTISEHAPLCGDPTGELMLPYAE